jgi:molybdopterin-guanine dinucleotide biosynthesis protein A
MGGAPKGLFVVEGRRILDRLVDEAIAAFGTDPLLVANAPDAARWRAGLPPVADLIPETGTLGGLYTAVVAGPAPIVCVAWDMPFVRAPLLRRLAEGLASADVFLPASDGRRGVEPLCAGYGPGCAEPMRAAIARGDFRAIAFHPVVRVGILPAAEVARFGPPERLFFNVNTAEDLAAAERLS